MSARVTIDLAAEAQRILGVIEAGWEARAYVTGALDPTVASVAARDAYVQEYARVSPRAAAAFIRGWVTREVAV